MLPDFYCFMKRSCTLRFCDNSAAEEPVEIGSVSPLPIQVISEDGIPRFSSSRAISFARSSEMRWLNS